MCDGKQQLVLQSLIVIKSNSEVSEYYSRSIQKLRARLHVAVFCLWEIVIILLELGFDLMAVTQRHLLKAAFCKDLEYWDWLVAHFY